MKWYKNFVVFWTIFYVIIAILGRLTTSNHEIFPFFRWSLYSKTPNSMNFAFVKVSKIGDSILNPPRDIIDLYDLHNISPVDMNLNVQHFYKDMQRTQQENQPYTGDFLEILPEKSNFELYVKTLDLTQVDYRSTEVINKVISVRNNRILSFER